MEQLVKQSPEWAIAVRDYAEQVLVPKLGGESPDGAIGLSDETIVALNLMADELFDDEALLGAVKWAIGLLVDALHPGVVLTDYEKVLLRAFAEGLLEGYGGHR